MLGEAEPPVSWFTSQRFPAKPTPVLQIVPVDDVPVQADDVLLDLAPTDLTAFSCHLTACSSAVELAKALWEAVTSPEFKIVAKGTFKAVRGMISLAAAIAPRKALALAG